MREIRPILNHDRRRQATRDKTNNPQFIMSKTSKSKSKPKRRNRGFPPVEAPAKPQPPKVDSSEKRPMRWGLIVLFLTISIGGSYLAIWMRQHSVAPRYTYKLINQYPSDEQAFTQGLVIDDGFLWISTGKYGQSTVRKVELESGTVLNSHALDDDLFGEGLTMHNDQLFQLTWKEGKALVYDRDLNPVKEFQYAGQGWGLTTDGTNLIQSDGSQYLKFFDPETYELQRTVKVLRKGGMAVGQLNELEYAGGKVYANRYMSDIVYEIEPTVGDVTGIIDLSGLWPMRERPEGGLLNGIAAIPGTRRMLVTGKLCPWTFEIELVPEESR